MGIRYEVAVSAGSERRLLPRTLFAYPDPMQYSVVNS
jgi:hypothetical protein